MHYAIGNRSTAETVDSLARLSYPLDLLLDSKQALHDIWDTVCATDDAYRHRKGKSAGSNASASTDN